LLFRASMSSSDNEAKIQRAPLSEDDEKNVAMEEENTNANAPFRFVVKDKKFTQQFAAIYYVRLRLLKQIALDNAREALKNSEHKNVAIVHKVPDVTEDTVCLVAGTLYKEMKLKPSILDEYADKHRVVVPRSHYRSDDDTLVLEDEYGRAKLVGLTAESLPMAGLVSGTVVAVLGRELESSGEFQVERIFFPGLPPQKPLPPPKAKAPARYVALVGGLHIGTNEPDYEPLPTQMMVDYITGLAGEQKDHELAASIVRVIVCGNALHKNTAPVQVHTAVGKAAKAKKAAEDKARIMPPLHELDMMLTQLASSVQVDLMPGETDPSNFALPQQPLHLVLFPTARTYSSFSCQTNPCSLATHGVTFVGSSGQPVCDLAKYAEASSPVEYLERCLQWRNIAPTAPDTLACYPFQDNDPFVMTECPHVFFAGNQDKFESTLIEGSQGQKVRLVCVPSFSKTGVLVLVNVNDLSVETIQFAVRS